MDSSSEGVTKGNEKNARGHSSEIEDTSLDFTSAISSIKEDDDTKYVSEVITISIAQPVMTAIMIAQALKNLTVKIMRMKGDRSC